MNDKTENPAMTSRETVKLKYDRALIADMLDQLRGVDSVTPALVGFTSTAIAEQARLLREADNASAAKVRTVSRASVPEVTRLIETGRQVSRTARLMHDDRQQEVVCIQPAEWREFLAALTAAMQEQNHG